MCLRARVSAGDRLWGRVRGGHARVSRRSVCRRGVGRWGRAGVCVLTCLCVSGELVRERACACVLECVRV